MSRGEDHRLTKEEVRQLMTPAYAVWTFDAFEIGMAGRRHDDTNLFPA